MCSQRIDVAYAHLSSIDEKTAPEERFIQLMDELSIDSDIKTYLEHNFSANFYDWFTNADQAEKALIETQKHSLLRDKVAAFLKESYPRQCFSFCRDMDSYSKNQEISADQKQPSEKIKKIEFLLDIAKTFFPNSLYDLYNSEFGKVLCLSFPSLSAIIHDNEYCFSSACFDDPVLNSLAHNERTEFLWSIFNEQNENQIYIRKNCIAPHGYNRVLLLEFIKSEENVSTSHSVTENFHRGFRFLKAWITNDAKNARSFNELISIIEEFCDNLYAMLFSENSIENEKFCAYDWCENLRQELKWILLQNFDLIKASEQDSDFWTHLMESYFCKVIRRISHSEDYPYLQQKQLEFKKLIDALQNDNVQYWLKSDIEQDIEKILDKDISHYDLLQSKWCFGEVYDSWKTEFLSQLNQLNPADQMRVLSISAPFIGHPACDLSEDAPDFYEKHSIWWNSIYLELPTSDDFEKQYLPEWTIAAKNKAETPDLTTYIDQSIGILRGQISGESSESDNDELMRQLSELLTWLEKQNSEKAMRHRLMLFRSSKTPLCDEGLNYRNKAEDCLWYLPLKDLKPSNFDSTKSLNDSLNEFYQSLAQQISTFCLSRLQLRKKEKAVDGKYFSNQVVEMSPTWRQGYLKAITEIGLDLNGKAHKTAHFIKQADEDENVRAIAAETYKAVRRSDNSNPSITDLKRGIIAAEWWLLHCQRQELGLEINSEEALKTRRRLLRNP